MLRSRAYFGARFSLQLPDLNYEQILYNAISNERLQYRSKVPEIQKLC